MSEIARVLAVALTGLDGALVTVEAGAARQLPGLGIVGLPDTALSEAKQRVRHATSAIGMQLNDRYVLINLQPADQPKHGSGFDLAIALAALGALGKIRLNKMQDALYIGELGLDGAVRRPRGLMASVAAAVKLGVKKVVVPAEAALEAALVPGVTIIAVETLLGAINWLSDKPGDWLQLTPQKIAQLQQELPQRELTASVDLADVVGQKEAVTALEVAAAGKHHMQMVGPPGAGKTMLAARLNTILPDLTRAEALETNSISALVGAEGGFVLSAKPPFISPHHTASTAAIIGSAMGGVVVPGAVSLASNGVLFLDEAQEFVPTVLDALRQPLENGKIEIHKALVRATLPAKFQLILASNPCPCGNWGSVKTAKSCNCTPNQIRRYGSKISGPLRDRIDLRVFVDRVAATTPHASAGADSATIRRRVAVAHEASAERWRRYGVRFNSEVPARILRGNEMRLSKNATAVLDRALEIGSLSLRGYDRTLRLAWSLCDLRGAAMPDRDDVAEALNMREGVPS